MPSQQAYTYGGRVLLTASAILFVLFLLLSVTPLTYKVYGTQSLLTLAGGTLIMSYIAFHGYEQQEFDTWLFFITFLAAIPLLYHLLYLAFFSEDIVSKLQLLKIYVLGVLVLYLAYIWSNTQQLLDSEVRGTNWKTLMAHAIQLLTGF